MELLIEIGNRDESFSFNTVLRHDYKQLSLLLEELVFTVFVEAHYNRSQTKVSLSQLEGARYDLEIALKLAEKRECDHIKSNIQRRLRELVNMD